MSPPAGASLVQSTSTTSPLRPEVPPQATPNGAACAHIMGAKIAALTEADAVGAIVDAARHGRGSWTITANLDHIRRYRREPLAKGLIDQADLVLADGTPLIWASRLAGTSLPERVAGSDMIWSISELASRCETSVYLLGGPPGVARKAASVLRARFRTLAVAGTLCPPIGFERDERELQLIYSELREAAPQIVFVGLGFPKQDVLIAALKPLLPDMAFIGVGASLSFVAGELRRAPRWMGQAGIEWVYRLLQEPRHLARRYMAQGLPFALWLLACALTQRVRRGAPAGEWGWSTLTQPASDSYPKPRR